MDFSDYAIYIDESGDHGLKTIDPEYPIFALAFVIVKKQDYIEKIVPEFMKLKFKYWGHDQIILHEHEMRKQDAPFGFLRTDAKLRKGFFHDINAIIEKCPFEYISAIIRKHDLKAQSAEAQNPYEIAMLSCMEHTLEYLLSKGQKGKQIHLTVESRGKKEDIDLELEFRRICDNKRKTCHIQHDFSEVPFKITFSDKKCNSSGLQLADLIVRPLGIHHLRPEQTNRAIEIIKKKEVSFKVFP